MSAAAARNESAKTKVFLSYSRTDSAFAARLTAALEERGCEVFRDVDDILPSEEWRARLAGLIGQSDSVIFIISPDSVASVVCEWEIEQTVQLGKRLVPVELRAPPPGKTPSTLSRLNYIKFDDESRFGNSVDLLVTALHTDIAWIREHTRLGELARRWEQRGRPDALLLRGGELIDAERWEAAHPGSAPAPTGLHATYIAAGRTAARRRSQYWTGGAIAVAVMSIALAGWALDSRRQAVEQRAVAESERDLALRNQARFLANTADRRRAEGDAVTGALIALAAMPQENQGARWPRLREVETALARSLREQRVLMVLGRSCLSTQVGLFDTSGRRLLHCEASSQSVSVLDVATSSTVVELTSPRGRITDASFNPKRDEVAVVTGTDTLELRDGSTGAELASLQAPGASLNDVFFSPDGSILAALSQATREIWLWRMPTREHLVTLSDPAADDRRLRRFLLDADHTRLMSYADNGRVIVWGLTAKEPVAQHASNEGSSGPPRIFGAGFRAGGPVLLRATQVTKDGQSTVMELLDGMTGRPTARLGSEDQIVLSGDLSADGSHALFGLSGNTGQVFDTARNEIAADLLGHDASIVHMSFIAGGTRVLTVSIDGTLRVWDAASGYELAVVRLPSVSFARNLVVSADGATLLLPMNDGSRWVIRLDDPGADTALPLNDVPAGYMINAAFSPEAGRLAVSPPGTDKISIHDLATGGRTLDIAVAPASRNASRGIAFSPDGHMIAAGYGSQLARIWDAATGTVVAELKGHSSSVLAVAFSADGRLLATTSGDRTAIVWDIATRKPILTLTGHTGSVVAAAFSADGKSIATSSRDRSARIWSLEDGKLLHTLQHRSAVTSVAFAGQTARLITSSEDNRVRVWNAEEGVEIVVLRGHTAPVVAAYLSPDGSLIASVSMDASLRLWDASTGDLVDELRGHDSFVFAAAFHPDGKRLMSFGADRQVRIWTLPPGSDELVAVARVRLPRCLSAEERAELNLPGEVPVWCASLRKWEPDGAGTRRSRTAERAPRS